MKNIRPAVISDLDAIEQIYDDIHTDEENGTQMTGWIRGVYPTRKTAEASICRGDMFVLEDGEIFGAGIINQIQVDVYENAPWEFETDDVCVLHTLVISPKASGRGYGKAFVLFYEQWASEHGLMELRIDTNARNKTARAMYRKLGYREIGIVPTVFNGIPGVDLVLLEKNLGIKMESYDGNKKAQTPAAAEKDKGQLRPIHSGEMAVSHDEAILLSGQVLPDPETNLKESVSTSMPIAELATLGSAVSSLLPAFRKVIQTTQVDMKGLYRLANAEAGDVLKAAKDGNFWGSLKKDDGKSKMLKISEAGPVSATNTTIMPIDPATIMMAAALYSIEQKLDAMLEMQKQILSFLETDRESGIEADVKMLASTLKEFKFNWDKEVFINGHYKLALDVKRTAEKNLQAYQKEVQDIKANAPLVAKANVNSAVRDMLKKFKYYRMSLYLFSMASFLEILLLGDYREEHILKVRNDIEERSMRYRQIYGACSAYIEKIAGKAVEANVLKGIGNAGKALGGLIGSIPLVKEGPVDEWLVGGGNALKKNAGNMKNDPLHELASVSSPGTGVFVEKMDDLNRIYNHTSRICFDDERIYLIAG